MKTTTYTLLLTITDGGEHNPAAIAARIASALEVGPVAVMSAQCDALLGDRLAPDVSGSPSERIREMHRSFRED